MTDGRRSAIYEGHVRHRRFGPVGHEFRYSLAMLYLDLDELPSLLKGVPGWALDRRALAEVRRSDYLGDAALPLAEAVRQCVAAETGRRPAGPIAMLTHARYFGYCFNPVTFYYCHDAAGERVETIVAEITNTPWNERRRYVLPAERSEGQGNAFRWRFTKDFHISPFMDVGLGFDWRFTPPGESLCVHMENIENGGKLFDATLTLKRRPASRGNLRRLPWRYPFMTAQVIAGIHWQALRLWLKKVPYYAHPRYREPVPERQSA